VRTDRCDLPDLSDGADATTRSWAVPLATDVAVVLVFALLGRISHTEGDLVTGTATTAAPFVLGLLAGWLRAPCAGMSAAARARTVRFGAWLLVWTMAGGILLRGLLGEGLAPAFLAVATGVLAVGLVGRRWVAQRWALRAPTGGAADQLDAPAPRR
jgi:uncharacterized membrane protein